MKTLIAILTLTFATALSAAEYRTFTVNDGEDLKAFSKRLYGTSTKMQEIMDLNKDALPTKESVQAGMTLKVKVNSKLRERMGDQGTKVEEVASAVTAPATADAQTQALNTQVNANANADIPAQPAPVYRSPASMNSYIGPTDAPRTVLNGEPRPVPSDRSPASETQRLDPKKPKSLDGYKHFEVALAEQNATKSVTKENISAPATAVNGHVSLMYGLSYATSSLQFVNFGLDAGYRFFDSTPNLSLGILGFYYSQGATIKGFGFYASPKWFFSDGIDGFSAGLGLGYAIRTTGGSGGAISFAPNVAYDFAVTEVFTIGASAVFQYSMFSGTPDTNLYGFLNLKYSF